ncbi:MAG: RND family transporter [Lachnospiraceae bacterium]
MKKFYTAIVNHRKTVITVFLLAALICLFLKDMVGVNYDMNDYLPEDSASTVSLDVMEEEFGSGIPNARVMVRDVTIPEAINYKEKLEMVDGVQEVTWLDDAVDIRMPLSSLDKDVVETYYKDDAALFSVTIEEDKRISAVEEIRTIIGEENAMSGSAVSTAVATTSTVSEINKIATFAVIFALFVLIITTDSYLKALVILGGLGVAVSINSGTNLIFGEISFVTNAAGAILQLAVSLDYSVFLMHRFDECRKETPNIKEAMVEALCKSTSSILSSGLTTVIGFAALILMQFKIGPDLGLALAKGVALSLITVFVFMPALILSLSKWIDKTKHRDFLPSFHKFGKAVSKLMIPAACILFLLIVPSYLASNANSYYYGSSHMFNKNTKLGSDIAAIEEVFGKDDTYVLLVPGTDMSIQKELSDELHTLTPVTGIISYVDLAGAEIPMEYLDEETRSKLISDHYSRMIISVDAEMEGKKTFELVEKVREIADSYYPDQYYLAGEGVSTYDLKETVTLDMIKVNLIAIFSVFVVLILLIKSVTLPIILVLCIETAIWLNLAIPYFNDSYVFYIAYLIISSVQLGSTVDYAILFSDRYREYRETMGKKEAVIETVSSVTVSIMTSGGVFSVVGFLLGKFSSNQLLAQLGNFLGVAGILSMIIVLFALPGFLYIFDRVFIRKREEKKNEKKNLLHTDGGTCS